MKFQKRSDVGFPIDRQANFSISYIIYNRWFSPRQRNHSNKCFFFSRKRRIALRMSKIRALFVYEQTFVDNNDYRYTPFITSAKDTIQSKTFNRTSLALEEKKNNKTKQMVRV